jgi:hypothetical protein
VNARKGLVLGVAALLLGGCGKYETRVRELGYKGPARVNPYLAAERFLGKNGYAAQSGASWQKSLEPVGTLIVPSSFLNSRGRLQQVGAWVGDGGHLIILRERGESFWNDFAKQRSAIKPDPNENLQAWLNEHLGVSERTVPSSVDPRGLLINDRTLQFQMDSTKVFDLDFEREDGEFGDADSESEQPDGHQILSLKWDQGRVTLMAQANPFRNHFIGNADHAELLLALLACSPSTGSVVFVYGGGISFPQMLWENAWAGLLGVLGVLVIWLWRNLPRFGPWARPAEEVVQPGYLQHIAAVGDFLWRHGRAVTLLAPLRREIMERFEHFKPAALDDDIFEWLGQRANIPRERVMRAMTDNGRPDAPTFTRITADLQQIRNSL